MVKSNIQDDKQVVIQQLREPSPKKINRKPVKKHFSFNTHDMHEKINQESDMDTIDMEIQNDIIEHKKKSSPVAISEHSAEMSPAVHLNQTPELFAAASPTPESMSV